jgi:hypothetical protein
VLDNPFDKTQKNKPVATPQTKAAENITSSIQKQGLYNGLGEELTIGGPAIIKVLYNTIDDKQ